MLTLSIICKRFLRAMRRNHPMMSNQLCSSQSSMNYYQGRGPRGYNDGDDDESEYGGQNGGEHPKKSVAEVAVAAHATLCQAAPAAPPKRATARPVASCATEALNMLLQQYKMDLPLFEYTTTRDAAGRSIFCTTVQVKNCIASAREYNKKLCKQAVCHQLLINIHQRYPKLNIAVYEPPQTTLTKFIGISADICTLVEEMSTTEFEENVYGSKTSLASQTVKEHDDPPQYLMEESESGSAVEKLRTLAKKFPGVGQPSFADVTIEDGSSVNCEVLCKLGCESVKGEGNSCWEAKENAAKRMMKLLGQVEPSSSVRDFQVSSDTKDILKDTTPEIEVKYTQRKANGYWAAQLKIESYGAGSGQNDALNLALEKAKSLIEQALYDLHH